MATREVYFNGELVESIEIETPAVDPTFDGRIAELEQTVETLLALLEG